MSFISFFYKIKDDTTKYYGKYCVDYISDDHNGLDIEVKYVLKTGLNRYREKNKQSKLKSNDIYVGVIAFSVNELIPTYSSNDEKSCFDFYCEHSKGITSFYINDCVFYG